MSSKCYVRATVLASLALVACPAMGEEQKDWSVLVGAGPFFGPEYLGSKDYGFVPGIIASVQKGPYFVKFNGLTATANVLPFDSFYAGPLIGYGTGRKDVSDNVVDKLPDVDEELWLVPRQAVATPVCCLIAIHLVPVSRLPMTSSAKAAQRPHSAWVTKSTRPSVWLSA